MTPDAREQAIRAAETATGSRLPPKLRAALIETGGVTLSCDFFFGTALALHDAPSGVALFANEYGDLLDKTRGWDFETGWDADWDPDDPDGPGGWELRDGAFIVSVSGSGDYGLLSPDAEGIARRYVFCDHEIGRLSVWADDVDALIKR